MNIYQAWVTLLKDILERGAEASPSNKKIKELVGHHIDIDTPYSNIIIDPQRKINYRFMVGNWLTTLTGIEDKILERYLPRLGDFETDGHGGTYPSYGPRLKPQWPFVLKTLIEDLQSRQAVMTVWESIKLSYEPDGTVIQSRYVPCTLSLQFLVRPVNGHHLLHTVATMRSSDAWLGLPYDIYNFTMLANFLVASLNRVCHGRIRVGSIRLNFGSSHLYEQHWNVASSLVNAPMGQSMKSPQIPSWVDTPFGIMDRNTAFPGWIEYQSILEAENNLEAFKILTKMEPN